MCRGSACDLMIAEAVLVLRNSLADIENRKRQHLLRGHPSRHLGNRSRRVESKIGIWCWAFGSIPYVAVAIAVTNVLSGWPRRVAQCQDQECWSSIQDYLPERCLLRMASESAI